MFRPTKSRFCLGFALFCSVALSAQSAPLFETRGIFTAESDNSPYSIAVGDFNHDGKLDLAVASGCCSAGGVSILIGRGDGTFEPSVYYPAGKQPFSIVAGDFNQDGNLDLAVANSLSNYVSILLGNGDGSFRPGPQNPPLSVPAIFVTVGDLNGDGIPDLVTMGSNVISVLLGNGDGSFQDAVVTQPPFAVQAIGVGDFNGDGKLDLATAGTFGASNSVNILLGNGDGTFSYGASYQGETQPAAIAVSDFNNDRKLDLAIAYLFGGIGVFIGNGDGTFQQAANYRVSIPLWVTAADLNGDHNVDLVVANDQQLFGPGGATVLLGNGDGTFRANGFYPCDVETSYATVGDFNGDGKPDLVVADFLNPYNAVTMLLNTGALSFSPTTSLTFPFQLVGTTSTSQTVTLTNTGTTALTIFSISLSKGQFNMSTTCESSLAPGAKCTITASFQPQSKGGHSAIVSIRDSASTKPQVIQLRGEGTVVSLSPPLVNFGSQKVGTKSKPEAVTVTNHGSVALNISGIRFHIGYGYFSQTNNCGSQLAVGASCRIAVTFAPAQTGKTDDQLSISDDGGGSPQTVLLTGTGT